MKLGEMLADMIRFGDVEEAHRPQEWFDGYVSKDGRTFMEEAEDDPELYMRLAIAATLLKLTRDGQGGSCSIHDKDVAPFLKQEMP